jgi:hypothetical protein
MAVANTDIRNDGKKSARFQKVEDILDRLTFDTESVGVAAKRQG